MKNVKQTTNYRHIKKAERLEIAVLRERKYSLRAIAEVLRRSPNTISKEIRDNSVNGIYDPIKAHHKSYVKRKYSKYQGMKVIGNIDLWNYTEEKLKQEWSPEIIAGRLKEIDAHIKYAGKGAIYKFISSVYGRRLEQYLYKNAVHKKPGPKKKKGEALQDRMFIDQRPEYINNRADFGDWEGDFIVSGQDGSGALLILYERKAKYVLMRKLLLRDTATVNAAIGEITGGMACFNSLTLDNDISFRKHKELSALLGSPIYFCHPYHSWEKGGVENMNKLIRRYIPKRTDISKLSDEFIGGVQNKFNHRPRKCLNFKTPHEVMKENNQFRYFCDRIFKNKQKNALSEAFQIKAECPA